MPPRLRIGRLPNLFSTDLVPSRLSRCPPPLCYRPLPRRYKSGEEKPLPKAEQSGPGPNQEQLPHVSEEAAVTSKIQGESGPDLEQGTPVQEVLQRDDKAQEMAPKVLKTENTSDSKPQSRSFSTSARRPQMLEVAQSSERVPRTGHTFALPTLPLPEHSHIKSKYRFEDIVYQVTRLIMRDGKLAKAERDLAYVLNHLRTAPPPNYSAARPLLPDAPPAAHLPLDPTRYLALAVDSVAPLMRIRSQRGAAGGGVALQLPVPLAVRQRRRRAVMWILDAVDKKPSRGSGRDQFAHRLAEELVAIVEGRSAVWEKRVAVHRLGTAARSNLNKGRRR